MGLGTKSHSSRTLLYGLQGVLHLMKSTLRRENSVVRIVGVSELFQSREYAERNSEDELTIVLRQSRNRSLTRREDELVTRDTRRMH